MRGNLVMDIHGMYLDQNTGQPSILTQNDKEQKKKVVTISKRHIYKKCKKVIYQCKENFRENRKSINLGLILILDYLSFGAGSYFLATGLERKWSWRNNPFHRSFHPKIQKTESGLIRSVCTGIKKLWLVLHFSFEQVVIHNMQIWKELKSRPCKDSLADICTSESCKNQPSLIQKKKWSSLQKCRSAEVQESAWEFSHVLDLRNDWN